MTHETKTLTVAGTELDATIQQHLAEGWRLIAQTTLGASEFEIVLSRVTEGVTT